MEYLFSGENMIPKTNVERGARASSTGKTPFGKMESDCFLWDGRNTTCKLCPPGANWWRKVTKCELLYHMYNNHRDELKRYFDEDKLVTAMFIAEDWDVSNYSLPVYKCTVYMKGSTYARVKYFHEYEFMKVKMSSLYTYDDELYRRTRDSVQEFKNKICSLEYSIKSQVRECRNTTHGLYLARQVADLI